jgi:pyruvate,water dikinase
MVRELTPKGVLVPNGFAITADAYRALLEGAGIETRLRSVLEGLDPESVVDLARRGRQARDLMLSASLPVDVREEILSAYHHFQEEYDPEMTVAVRSSATAEDLPAASFAGQQDSFLNVRGDAALLDACRRCFASLFTDRAIHYRIDQGFDHFQVALSIGVQKMVRSDLAASGVMFTLDPESGHRDVVFVTSAYGLGENVVQGTVDPDEFYVHKPTFRQGHRCVLRRSLGEKKIHMVYSEGRTRETTRNIPTPRADRERFSISDAEVLALAGYAVQVEDHYSRSISLNPDSVLRTTLRVLEIEKELGRAPRARRGSAD